MKASQDNFSVHIQTMGEVRPELLTSPWTEDDGVIREFLFAHDASLEQQMAVWEFTYDPTNQCLTSLPFGVLCFPIGMACYDTVHTLEYENLVEQLYARRLAVTKDGIMYKTLRKKPMTYDPTNPCAACCCAIGKFKDGEIGASSKVIPFDRVQDVRTEQAAGGTRRIVQVGGCLPFEQGAMIPDVDASCDVDTAGFGIELMVPGLVNAPNFRTTVLALKHGRELPPLEKGVVEGSTDMSALRAPPSRAEMKRTSSSAKMMRYAPAPESLEMSRVTEEHTELLRSIDASLAKLVSLTEKSSLRQNAGAEAADEVSFTRVSCHASV